MVGTVPIVDRFFLHEEDKLKNTKTKTVPNADMLPYS